MHFIRNSTGKLLGEKEAGLSASAETYAERHHKNIF
jgi:hypothetical protein